MKNGRSLSLFRPARTICVRARNARIVQIRLAGGFAASNVRKLLSRQGQKLPLRESSSSFITDIAPRAISFPRYCDVEPAALTSVFFHKSVTTWLLLNATCANRIRAKRKSSVFGISLFRAPRITSIELKRYLNGQTAARLDSVMCTAKIRRFYVNFGGMLIN